MSSDTEHEETEIKPRVLTIEELRQSGAKKAEVKDMKLRRVKAILRSLGIEMSVGSCGCCESPWVSFKYHDEQILDGEDAAGFDTAE